MADVIVKHINDLDSHEGRGTFLEARVGPGQKRKLVPGDDGVTLLALGSKPGAFEANV
jgi:hypothetical protein